MPNIGKVLEINLNNVGITTKNELIAFGSKQVFTLIKTKDPTACVNKLMAIEGAIQGIRWHNLSGEVKAEMKKFYNKL